ncbi:MAG: hypothetical protein SGPRY_006781, partial [Prymnesium sp.]
MSAWGLLLLSPLSTAALRPPLRVGRVGGARMQVPFNDPDVTDSFADDELASTWARAGKGRPLWQPGDKTDDPLLNARLLYSAWVLNPLTLHAYDSCPFCARARLVLGWNGIPSRCEFYPYGQGADPELCEGFGYSPSEGPIQLTGKKQLPVLTGQGLPLRNGVEALTESLEICSFAAAVSKKPAVAPATGRADVSSWLDRVAGVSAGLVRPRVLKLDLSDFRDDRDVAYARWRSEQGGFDYKRAEDDTPSLLQELQPLLEEVE